MTRFAFIDAEKAPHDVAVLCRLIEVSRSGFYAWLRRPRSPQALADEVLTEQIRTAFEDNRKVYGAPRIRAELSDAGVHVGRKRLPSADAPGPHRGQPPPQAVVLDHPEGSEGDWCRLAARDRHSWRKGSK